MLSLGVCPLGDLEAWTRGGDGMLTGAGRQTGSKGNLAGNLAE